MAMREITFYVGPEPQKIGYAVVLDDGTVKAVGRVAAILHDLRDTRTMPGSQAEVVDYILRNVNAFPYAWAWETT